MPSSLLEDTLNQFIAPGGERGTILPVRRAPPRKRAKGETPGRLEPAVPGLFVDILKGLAQTGDTVRDAARGDWNVENPADMQRGINAGLNVSGPGMLSPKPASALGVFGSNLGMARKGVDTGEALADMLRLSRHAKRSQSMANTELEGLWRQHGLSLGPEGQVRFEIPDDGFRVKRDAGANLLGEAKLYGELDDAIAAPFKFTDIFEHPQLLDLYPELKNYGVQPYVGKGAPLGLFSPKEKAFGFNLSRPDGGLIATADEILGTGRHEVQHGIQDLEGLQGGFSVEAGMQVKKKIEDTLKVAYGPNWRARVPYASLPRRDPTAPPGWDVANETSIDDVLDFLPHNLYTRAAGEVEARAADRRGNRRLATPDAVRLTPPHLPSGLSTGVTNPALRHDYPLGGQLLSPGSAIEGVRVMQDALPHELSDWLNAILPKDRRRAAQP